MGVRIEQAEFGRVHIWMDDPMQNGVTRRYTYLLGDNKGMGEKIYRKGSAPESGDKVTVEATTDHREIIKSCGLSLTLLGRRDLADLLPKDDEPLSIYQEVNYSKLPLLTELTKAS